MQLPVVSLFLYCLYHDICVSVIQNDREKNQILKVSVLKVSKFTRVRYLPV
jgi:hypothetical protein